ncbi:MAG: cytochrome C, partial [Gammaproteobacteria bacterium]|nr:cytochrome C [Gammaproteobacteria bacterium]
MIIKKTFILSFLVFAWLVQGAASAKDEGCMACHKGIEQIREDNSGMMAMIKAMGSSHGDKQGCVICHGGDPTAKDAKAAHSGSPSALISAQGPQTFYPDPGAMDINKYTCGQSACHKGYEDRLEKSLMNTEAG